MLCIQQVSWEVYNIVSREEAVTIPVCRVILYLDRMMKLDLPEQKCVEQNIVILLKVSFVIMKSHVQFVWYHVN